MAASTTASPADSPAVSPEMRAMLDEWNAADEPGAGHKPAPAGPDEDEDLPGEPLPLSTFVAAWDRFTLGPAGRQTTYRIGEPTWGDQARVEQLIRMLPPVVTSAVLAPAEPGSADAIDVAAVARTLRATFRTEDGGEVRATDAEVGAELYRYSRGASAQVQVPLLGIILIGLAGTHPDVTEEDLRPHLSFSRAVTVARRVLGLGGNMAADFLPPGGTAGTPAGDPPPPTPRTPRRPRTRVKSTARSS